jgi:nitrogen fixation/metabolism regulation signal transduction histidine kinase
MELSFPVREITVAERVWLLAHDYIIYKHYEHNYRKKYIKLINYDIYKNISNNTYSLKYNFVRKIVCVKSRDFVCINTDDYVKKSYTWISVLDEGTGVLKIGEFLNGYKVISSKIKGTGLGIPIVRKILSYHNSHLSLLTKIKKGSCFSFLLKISR